MLFIDLRTRLSRVRSEVDRRIAAVLDHGQFILGPEVEELEELEQERQQSASSAAMGQGAMVAAHVAIFAERMLSTNTVATSEPPTSKKKSTRRTRKKNSSNRPRRPTRAEKKENVQDAVKSTL